MSVLVLENEEAVETSLDIPQSPPQADKPLTMRERLQLAAKRFAKEGISAVSELPAEVYVQAKFPSDVKPPKGWESAMAGKKAGEVTCREAAEHAGGAIMDKRQASCPIAQDGKVRLSISAQRDVTLPEDAATQLAGKFITECGYAV